MSSGGIGNILAGICSQFPPAEPDADALLYWNEANGEFDFAELSSDFAIVAGVLTFTGSSGGGGSTINLTANTTLVSGASNNAYTNDGAASLIEVTLPAAAAGLKFTFLVSDPDGFKLIAAGSDVIRIAGSETPPAGSMTSTQQGGAVVLYGRAGGWIAASSQRTWIDA